MSLKAIIWVMEDAPVEDQGELAVLYALADRASNDGSGAFPSQAWIAQRARCTDRSVRNVLRKLEDRGVIRKGDPRFVDHIQGNRRPTVWDLNLDLRRAENDSGRKVTTVRPENDDSQTGKSRQLGRKPVSDKPSLTILEPSNNQYMLKSENLSESFDEFWQVYPRRVGKKTARDRFAAAVKRVGDPSVIIDGARRLADDPNLPEARFIPHPSTWLGRDGWEDDPLPSRGGSSQSNDLSAWLGSSQGATQFVQSERVRELG